MQLTQGWMTQRLKAKAGDHAVGEQRRKTGMEKGSQEVAGPGDCQSRSGQECPGQQGFPEGTGEGAEVAMRWQ